MIPVIPGSSVTYGHSYYTARGLQLAAAMMDPGQDLLLAALSECGISPNDLFDGDSLDIGLLAPSPAPINQQPPSTTTFVLNQINQLPTLGNTIVMAKTSPVTTTRPTITVTKILQTSATTRPSTAAPVVQTTVTAAPTKEQIQLKDLLKNSSLNKLMKLKPPSNIAQPVATAATDLLNGAKKDITNKEVTRICLVNFY
ncbi:protein strawberry notch homolog 1 [Pyxicephalus adspersus]|uniref:protein strawberry notch homolog 1 n=1 Tax=Pyxicephalus adspersus TaxID=30357 RepID=UPI003B5C433B